MESLRDLSGAGIVSNLCVQLNVYRGLTNNALGTLAEQITAYDSSGEMPELVKLLEGFKALSEKSFGLGRTFPNFTLEIPQQMLEQAETIAQQRIEEERIAEEERLAEEQRIEEERIAEAERLEAERMAQLKADAQLETEQRERYTSQFNGDNRVQVVNYIKAYNYCVIYSRLDAAAFTRCFNAGMFALEDETPTIDQITEDQGLRLFNALHSIAGESVIESCSPVYNALTSDQAILNAGDSEKYIADTEARIAAIVTHAEEVANQRIIQEQQRLLRANPVTHSQITGNTLDGLFALYNLYNTQSEFQKGVLGETGVTSSTKEEKQPAIAKLYCALKHFADKNDNGQLSFEQIEMLKNNSAFMQFIGWICSLLPELLQIGLIANCTNRYHVSRFQEEALPVYSGPSS